MHSSLIKLSRVKLSWAKGWSPGLVVMGDDSCCGFESRHHILDGHDIFSHWFVVKKCMVCLKRLKINEKEAIVLAFWSLIDYKWARQGSPVLVTKKSGAGLWWGRSCQTARQICPWIWGLRVFSQDHNHSNLLWHFCNLFETQTKDKLDRKQTWTSKYLFT